MSEPDLELEVAWQQYVSRDQHALVRLLARHREPQRHYHTAQHVAWVIRHVRELADAEPVDHVEEVVAAAFYHDAVYEATSSGNEQASARLARRDLADLGWADDAVARVGSMIEATRHDHSTGEEEPRDTSVLLDADLAILGADPAAYSAYASGVRAEYHHLDDEAWRTGRAAVIAGFLGRPTIFRTPSGRDRWEDRARANLTAELATLEA